MKLIDRYIGAVAQYLPADRREDIARELRANILDCLEQKNKHTPTEADASAILQEMGHPQKVAASFLPPQKLVADDLFPVYKTALGYTSIIIFMVHVIKAGAAFISSGYLSIVEVLFSFADTALLGFAIITGIFYVLSNPSGSAPLYNPYAGWKPEQLPPVSNRPWQQISACDQASEFSINVFLLLMLFPGVWMSAETLAHLGARFAEPALPWLPWITGLVVVLLGFNLWNLRFDYWTRPKLLVDAALSLSGALIALGMSRLSEIVILLPPAEARGWQLEMANKIVGMGLVLVGLWLLFEAGKAIYRFNLLGKKQES